MKGKKKKRKSSLLEGYKGKGKQVEGQGKESRPNTGCSIYGGPFYARECLKKEKLNTILVMMVKGKKQSHTST